MMGALGRLRRRALKASGRYQEIRKTRKNHGRPRTRGTQGAFGRQEQR